MYRHDRGTCGTARAASTSTCPAAWPAALRPRCGRACRPAGLAAWRLAARFMARLSEGLERRLVRVEDAAEDLAFVYAERAGCPSDHPHDLWVDKLRPVYELEVEGNAVACHQADSSNLEKGITGGIVWDAAVVLAKALEEMAAHRAVALARHRVIELGAGTGLLGLCAAALGADVVLTDQAPQLRLMSRSLALNERLLQTRRDAAARRDKRPGEQHCAHVCELDWEHFDAADFTTPRPPTAILCSDCVYNPSLIAPLVACAKELCAAADEALGDDEAHGGSCVVWFAMEVRAVDVLEEFVEALVEAFHVARLPLDLQAASHTSKRALVYACRLRKPWGLSMLPDEAEQL